MCVSTQMFVCMSVCVYICVSLCVGGDNREKSNKRSMWARVCVYGKETEAKTEREAEKEKVCVGGKERLGPESA